MKLLLSLVAALPLFAQAKDPVWEAVASLAGEWVGEGSGEPGAGQGGFTFTSELQGKLMVRRNRAEYKTSVHEDFMTVYREPGGGKVRATYYDNEGHLIQYAVTAEGPRIVFVSDPIAAEPRYRLTYEKSGPDRVKIKFEIAPPGKPDEFRAYIEAAARRK